MKDTNKRTEIYILNLRYIMGFKYYQIYFVWLLNLLDWKTISMDLHRGPPSIIVMNLMLISKFLLGVLTY